MSLNHYDLAYEQAMTRVPCLEVCQKELCKCDNEVRHKRLLYFLCFFACQVSELDANEKNLLHGTAKMVLETLA